jgi:hypothetical protein
MNPFKVGDKVKLLKRSYEFNPIFWRRYEGFKYSFVRGVVGDTISTSEDISPQHYSHFELYKEEKDMTPQAQQKTKRVPFTHELWEKWKDKGGKVLYANGPHIIKDMLCFDNAVTTYRYAGYCEERDCIYVCEGDDLSLEIPVTTKRIPFNPELKDAKVFYGKTELTEWFQAKTGVICGTHTNIGFGGEDTSLYHPNDLEMEIET